MSAPIYKEGAGIIDRFVDSAIMAKDVFAAIGRGGNELAKERKVVSLHSQRPRYFLSFHTPIFPFLALGKGGGVARSRGNLSISPLFQDVLYVLEGNRGEGKLSGNRLWWWH